MVLNIKVAWLVFQDAANPIGILPDASGHFVQPFESLGDKVFVPELCCRGQGGLLWVVDGSKEVRLVKQNKLESVLALKGVKTNGDLLYQAGQLLVFSNQQELLAYDPVTEQRASLLTGLQQVDSISDIRVNERSFLYNHRHSHREELVLFEPN